jgi:hypothetical protein
MVLAACGEKRTDVLAPQPGPLVGFDRNAATAANGVISKADPATTCGSPTVGFGTELTSTDPAKAKVNFEWGFIGEDQEAEIRSAARTHGEQLPLGAIREPKQVYATGLVKNFHLFGGDLPFTHPFGNDANFDIDLDPRYQQLDQLLGAQVPSGPLGGLHTELEQALFPHQGPNVETDFLSGFLPQNGDRVAAVGPWIIDCGHTDFHTEIHPITFAAYGHADGQTTVAHAFYNPYRETQFYNPDSAVSPQVANLTRFGDPKTRSFVQYLVGELLRVGHLAQPFHDQIQAFMLEKANTLNPLPWFVCAPTPRPGNAALSVSYSFTTRPGVSIDAQPDASTGCVRFTPTFGPDYTPLNPIGHVCELDWDTLNEQAQQALGSPDVDIRALIEKQVPASFIPSVEKNPLMLCYDPLQVNPPGTSGKAQSVAVSGSQPFPFYGEIKVGWAGGSSS